MALIRFIVVGLIVLTVVYFSISIYSRSVRREKLEKTWDADNPGGDLAERETFVEQGMEDYENGFRKRLILLVYVIPIVAVGIILYVTNAN